MANINIGTDRVKSSSSTGIQMSVVVNLQNLNKIGTFSLWKETEKKNEFIDAQ